MRLQSAASSARRTIRTIALHSIAGLLVAGCAAAGIADPLPQSTSTPILIPTPAPLESVQSQAIDAQGLDIVERRLIDVYKRVAPSVVNVTTHVRRRGLFAEMIPREGFGSGFVIDREGHILTNFHVIEGAQQIEVELEAGLVFPALVIGYDRRFDLALLQIDAPAELLHPASFGSSAGLQVGQRAIAIGNPFGQFSRSLTTGVISGLERTLEGHDEQFIGGIIQTAAAINQGNSGGPLLDSSGRVIGIITALFSPSGASTGVSFALPIDMVKRALPELMALGRYRHPYLGIRFSYQITPYLADALDLPVEAGLLLVQLDRRGPLDRAGIQGTQRRIILWNQQIYIGGDILTAVNDHPIESEKQLQLLLEDLQVGEEVTVSLVRGDAPFEVRASLAEAPE